MEPDSSVWSDYDGETIYGDYEVVFAEDSGTWTKQIVEKTAYLPGVAQMDRVTGEVVYFHTDQIGTTRVITSNSLAQPHRFVSTAFGERVHTDGTVGTRYQYAGTYGYETLPAWDSTTKEYLDDENVPFVHVGHRYYNPETGRFLQRDPIGIRGGLNTYTYVRSGPTVTVDPDGLCAYQPDPRDWVVTPKPDHETEWWGKASICVGGAEVGVTVRGDTPQDVEDGLIEAGEQFITYGKDKLDKAKKSGFWQDYFERMAENGGYGNDPYENGPRPW